MAGRNANHLLFAPAPAFAVESSRPVADEFDESDVWGYETASVVGRPEAATRAVMKAAGAADRRAGASTSVPVNVPDWSKILGSSYDGGRGNKRGWLDCACCEDDEDAEAARPMIPPHELLCRSRGASFSVHEGIGRTLKGRDLSRVRNAIWAKTGFQD